MSLTDTDTKRQILQCICKCVYLYLCVCVWGKHSAVVFLWQFFLLLAACYFPLLWISCQLFGFAAEFQAKNALRFMAKPRLWPRSCLCVSECVWDKVFHVVNGPVCFAGCFPSFASHFFHLLFPVDRKNSRLIESYLFLLRSHIDSQIYIRVYIYICVCMEIYVRALA